MWSDAAGSAEQETETVLRFQQWRRAVEHAFGLDSAVFSLVLSTAQHYRQCFARVSAARASAVLLACGA